MVGEREGELDANLHLFLPRLLGEGIRWGVRTFSQKPQIESL